MTALETLFAAIDALRAAEDRGSTHWQGCEAVHPRCAVYLAADAARPMAARADAADRYARAALAYFEPPLPWDADEADAFDRAATEYKDAWYAYRARKAQEVARIAAEDAARIATRRLGEAFGNATVTQPGPADNPSGAGNLAPE